MTIQLSTVWLDVLMTSKLFFCSAKSAVPYQMNRCKQRANCSRQNLFALLTQMFCLATVQCVFLVSDLWSMPFSFGRIHGNLFDETHFRNRTTEKKKTNRLIIQWDKLKANSCIFFSKRTENTFE